MLAVLTDMVTQLSTRHLDRRSGQLRAPLLGQLRGALRPSLGKTQDGHSGVGERSVLNIAAFDLYEDIDGRIASLWLMATETGRLRGSPEKNLQAWYVAFAATWAFGEISDAQLLLALARTSSFVTRIENYFDPPLVREVLAPCPTCSQRYAIVGGVRVSALYVEYRRGSELMARCHCCPSVWAGDAQLVGLAKAIGATIDVDALRDARAPSGVHW